MRLKSISLVVAALLIALVVPAASADVCIGSGGCQGGGSGSGGAGSTTPLNRLAVSNGFDGGFAPAPVTPPDDCVFHIKRLKPRKGTTTVAYHTQDGTATAGNDYVATEGIATFGTDNPGDFDVRVQTLRDFEPASNTVFFFLKLGKSSNGDKVDATGKCTVDESPQE